MIMNDAYTSTVFADKVSVQLDSYRRFQISAFKSVLHQHHQKDEYIWEDGVYPSRDL